MGDRLSAPGLSLRWSGAGERAAHGELMRRAWHRAYGQIFDRALIDDVFDGRVAMQGSWVDDRGALLGTLVADAAGTTVGVATLVALHGGEAELAALYVLPDWQRRGVGSALWDAAVAELRRRGVRRMRVWALRRAAACRFYEARGCVETARGGVRLGLRVEAAVGYTLDIDPRHPPDGGSVGSGRG